MHVRLSVSGRTNEREAQIFIGRKPVTKKLPLSAFNSDMQKALQALAPDQAVACRKEEYTGPTSLHPLPASEQSYRIPVERDRSVYFAVGYLAFGLGCWLLDYASWPYAVVYLL